MHFDPFGKLTCLSRRHSLALGLAGLATSVGGARAASSFPQTWTFGDVTVTKIVELEGPASAASVFPDAPPEAFTEAADWMVPHFYDPAKRNIIFSYIMYVVRTPRQIVLVDAGYGNDKTRASKFSNQLHGRFLEDLRAAGVTPDQVNFVINTHFGVDHIGWNTRLVGGAWVPTFPKARYLYQRAEIEAFKVGAADVQKEPGISDSVEPIMAAKLVDVIDGDHDLGDGLQIAFTPGHTAGHQTLTINSKGQRAVLFGDLLHSPIQVRYPEWVPRYDKLPELGRTQRTKFVTENTDVDVTLFAAHFGGPTAGKFVSGKDGKRRFQTLVA